MTIQLYSTSNNSFTNINTFLTSEVVELTFPTAYDVNLEDTVYYYYRIVLNNAYCYISGDDPYYLSHYLAYDDSETLQSLAYNYISSYTTSNETVSSIITLPSVTVTSSFIVEIYATNSNNTTNFTQYSPYKTSSQNYYLINSGVPQLLGVDAYWSGDQIRFLGKINNLNFGTPYNYKQTNPVFGGLGWQGWRRDLKTLYGTGGTLPFPLKIKISTNRIYWVESSDIQSTDFWTFYLSENETTGNWINKNIEFTFPETINVVPTTQYPDSTLTFSKDHQYYLQFGLKNTLISSSINIYLIEFFIGTTMPVLTLHSKTVKVNMSDDDIRQSGALVLSSLNENQASLAMYDVYVPGGEQLSRNQPSIKMVDNYDETTYIRLYADFSDSTPKLMGEIYNQGTQISSEQIL